MSQGLAGGDGGSGGGGDGVGVGVGEGVVSRRSEWWGQACQPVSGTVPRGRSATVSLVENINDSLAFPARIVARDAVVEREVPDAATL